MSRADRANAQAAAFLIAQEDGDWSSERQAALEAWLSETDGNKAAYWRLKHGWRQADRIASLGRNIGAGRASAITPRRWLAPAALAASVVLVFVFSPGGPIPHERSERIATTAYDTPVGKRRSIGLVDGSSIQLNTASALRTAITPGRREVWLDRGEAYFEVAHRAGRPFTVHAGDRRITVLGTKFSVRRTGDEVTVAVLEGRVRVADVKGRDEVRSSTISGGDIALARGEATLVSSASEERVERALAWRLGLLSFDQMRLGDVAAEFNRYNATQIVIADPAVAHIRVGGVFSASDPDAFARLLRDAYGLKIAKTPGSIAIYS